MIDATLIAAPISTKNSTGEINPEMNQIKRENQWHFGMKARIGADVDSGLVHSAECKTANSHETTNAINLLHGQNTNVLGDTGYQRIEKHAKAQELEVQRHIAMRPGMRRVLDKTTRIGGLKEKLEKLKVSIRAKVEHPFLVIKCQFSNRKTRYRYCGKVKYTAQLIKLFALSNLWIVRKRILIANV